MAPKASKKAAKELLQKPIVAAADLAEAEKVLKDQAELKRARASLTYFLERNGIKDKFSSQSMKERNEFLKHWFADQVAKKSAKKQSTSEHSVQSSTHKSNDFRWLSKQQMVNEFGETKAMARINSKLLESRPDPVTKLDDDDNREYKNWEETGGS